MTTSLVDFFVIGVARGGTTSLYNYLQQHPGIFLPAVKECNYFSVVESLDKEVYERPKAGEEYHMKIIRSEAVYSELFLTAEEGQLKGEVSPSYMWDQSTAARIFKYNKEAKIIVSLRNPIERAFSHYLMHVHTGHEKAATFEEALAQERNTIWGGGNMYLEMSTYYSQLKPYFDLFDKRQIRVLIQEEWTQHSAEAMNDTFRFLGAPPTEGEWNETTFNASKQLKNKGLLDVLRSKKIKNSLRKIVPEKTRDKIKEKLFYKDGPKAALDSATYEKLKAYFKEDMKQTEALTGLELSEKWNFN